MRTEFHAFPNKIAPCCKNWSTGSRRPARSWGHLHTQRSISDQQCPPPWIFSCPHPPHFRNPSTQKAHSAACSAASLARQRHTQERTAATRKRALNPDHTKRRQRQRAGRLQKPARNSQHQRCHRSLSSGCRRCWSRKWGCRHTSSRALRVQELWWPLPSSETSLPSFLPSLLLPPGICSLTPESSRPSRRARAGNAKSVHRNPQRDQPESCAILASRPISGRKTRQNWLCRPRHIVCVTGDASVVVLCYFVDHELDPIIQLQEAGPAKPLVVWSSARLLHRVRLARDRVHAPGKEAVEGHPRRCGVGGDRGNQISVEGGPHC